MTKWNEPPEPTPSWLDAAQEVTHEEPKLSKNEFVLTCIRALIQLGCTEAQALSVVANSINETGWGQYYRANNLGGWKITKVGAESYRRDHGKGPRWWRAPGNKSSGDPPWCYYRAFDAIGFFLSEWLTHFVPKPLEPAPYGIYKACGQAFWGGGDWFPLLVHAGYKGSVTQTHPAPAIAEHASLVRSAAKIWAARIEAPRAP